MFAAGEAEGVGKLVFAVAFFAQLEGLGADAVELFGDAVVGESETELFVRVGLGEGFDKGGEVGISGEHDGNVKGVGCGKTEAGAGYGDVGFFFLEDGDELVEVVGPGLSSLKPARVEDDFAGGEGPDVELVAGEFAGVFLAEVVRKGGEVVDGGSPGTAADEMEGGVAEGGEIEPLEGDSVETLFGGFDRVVEVEAVDEEDDAGGSGACHGGWN